MQRVDQTDRYMGTGGKDAQWQFGEIPELLLRDRLEKKTKLICR